LRFVGICYRSHDPKWSFKPISGEGAAKTGGRFNPPGIETLYLARSIVGAAKETTQGLARKIDPMVLCSYDVDCEDVLDLTDARVLKDYGILADILSCAWRGFLLRSETPPSWKLSEDVRAKGAAGIIVPSFAPGAANEDRNLVLWKWGKDLPYRVRVYDPSNRLPKNQLSWD